MKRVCDCCVKRHVLMFIFLVRELIILMTSKSDWFGMNGEIIPLIPDILYNYVNVIQATNINLHTYPVTKSFL